MLLLAGATKAGVAASDDNDDDGDGDDEVAASVANATVVDAADVSYFCCIMPLDDVDAATGDGAAAE